jgi:hypothetical protein
MLRSKDGIKKMITNKGLVLLIPSVEYRECQRIPTDPVNVGFDGSVQKVQAKDLGSLKRRKDLPTG